MRSTTIEAGSLDFVVMNPPFHDGGAEDRLLGQTFIRQAAIMLRRGGLLWVVANRHLPYEAVLGELFRTATPQGDHWKIVNRRPAKPRAHSHRAGREQTGRRRDGVCLQASPAPSTFWRFPQPARCD